MNNARIIIDELTGLETIKIWSLIVTMFGDLDGPSLSGKEIGKLLRHLGIKPEAIRVALHRLKGDDWVVTSKTGREVTYSLSITGQAETAAVYEDVYRADLKYPQGWKLQLRDFEQAGEEPKGPELKLYKNIVLAPAISDASASQALDLEFSHDHLPSWFADRIVQPGIVEAAEQLCAIYLKFDEEQGEYSPVDLAAIRLLFLHHWRKMALRKSTWAHIALFDDGALARFHNLVTNLLHRLPKLEAGQFRP